MASLPGFVWGLTWNKYTQGSTALFLTGYMLRAQGVNVLGWLWRGAAAGSAEIYASGFFGHQGRAIGALAKTTPGQIAIGAVVGYGIGLGAGYLISKEVYGQEGADLFLDVMTPGGEVGILTREAWTDVIGPSLVIQSGRAAKRRSKMTLKEVLREEATKFVLGPVLGPVYGFFKSDER